MADRTSKKSRPAASGGPANVGRAGSPSTNTAPSAAGAPGPVRNSGGREPTSGRPAGAGGRPATAGGRPASASGRPTGAGGRPTGKSGRQSVAAARASSSKDRTQVIIGGIAVALIAAVVIIGLVINKKNSAVQAEGYGAAKASTATVANGVITVAAGDPRITIDLYEDALCPRCGEFEHQYGQQIAQLTDQGKLRVNLHLLNFLDEGSASKDYSTRAAAALLAVATEAGDQPGLVLKFHTALFDPANQPTEGASTDLSNAQLAQLAAATGVPASVTTSIDSGKYVTAAGANAKASSAAVQAATGGVQTPTVLSGGKPLATNDVKWLTKLVG